jgi:hypothetical protein
MTRQRWPAPCRQVGAAELAARVDGRHEQAPGVERRDQGGIAVGWLPWHPHVPRWLRLHVASCPSAGSRSATESEVLAAPVRKDPTVTVDIVTTLRGALR